MPFTQHLWTWDRFLHGGQDFESGALLILASLCLALVMVKCCKRSVELLLAAGRLFLLAPPGRDLTGSWLRGVVFARAGEQQAACLLLNFRNLPLQI